MTSTDSIAAALRHDILARSLKPGERLVEAVLCERYDCGRAAVRTALVELRTEGLIEWEANRGATVRRLTVDEAVEVTEARSALESLMAAKAAVNATPDDHRHLQTIITEMRAAIAASDWDGYSSLNAALHLAVRELSGHTVAAQLVSNLRNRSTHHHFRLSFMPGRPQESVEQHAAIVDAIVAGNADQARAAMVAHLASAIETITSWDDVATDEPGP